MSIMDIAIGALCAWRENRGGGRTGMQSILNVLCNRAVERNTTIYSEAIRKHQFSSLAEDGDPQLDNWPAVGDPQMAVALDLAQQALDGQLPDITQGATLYYAPRVLKTKLGKVFTPPGGTPQPFPDGWNIDAVHFTAEVAGQLFFKEG